MQIRLLPSAVGGTVAAPPSKSLAHRAVLCAALSDGKCRVSHLEPSQDVEATLAAAQQMGCRLEREGDSVLFSSHAGFATFIHPVDCGESGSTLRFLIPVFSLSGQKVHFTGRGRLLARPQDVYAELLPAHGTLFTQDESEITVFGALQPGKYQLPGNVSSQFISGLLFALPLLDRASTITIAPPFESRSYVELTRATQAAFGVQSAWRGDDTLYIPGDQHYTPCDYAVEGDYSQAAFLAVLGAAAGDITLTGLRENSLQGDAVLLDILARCGAAPVRTGDAVRFARSALTAADIDIADCPDLGPILMVLGALCHGTTILRNAARLRLKESDRIAAMEQELHKFGVAISSSEDTVTIVGGVPHAPDGPLDAHNDHRVAMSLAVLALASGRGGAIDGAEAVEKSWPDFWRVLRALGAKEAADAR
jgi:3-phosphoshikimate 1-carboxyvinyltransferase